MTKAIWNGALLAESNDCVVVEGNHYFPPEAGNRAYLRESQTHTTCQRKGVASYYDVVVDDKINKDAAWYYPEPNEGYERIRGRIAFWKGVEVTP